MGSQQFTKAFVFSLVILAVGCGRVEGGKEPISAPKAEPTAPANPPAPNDRSTTQTPTTGPGTDTPAPVAAPQPSATPAPVATPVPTATPVATPAPTATPAPVATPTPTPAPVVPPPSTVAPAPQLPKLDLLTAIQQGQLSLTFTDKAFRNRLARRENLNSVYAQAGRSRIGDFWVDESQPYCLLWMNSGTRTVDGNPYDVDRSTATPGTLDKAKAIRFSLASNRILVECTSGPADTLNVDDLKSIFGDLVTISLQ